MSDMPSWITGEMVIFMDSLVDVKNPSFARAGELFSWWMRTWAERHGISAEEVEAAKLRRHNSAANNILIEEARKEIVRRRLRKELKDLE